MNTSVSGVSSAGTLSIRPPVASTGTPPRPAAAPDRIAAAQAPTAPLLTIGAVALAQLVPGVVEAEGASAIATTIAIGARAALANPVVNVAIGAVGTLALGYVKSLAHDALAANPGLKPLADAGSSLNSSIHMGLGIPPSKEQQ